MRKIEYGTKGARESGSAALIAIGIFKLLKAVMLLILGFAALHLVGRDVADSVTRWVRFLHGDPSGRHLRRVLSHVLSLDDRKLREVGAALFIYSALYFVEGIGLLLRQRWAEYFTIISTSLLIPVEIYELFRNPTGKKAALLLVNAAIVLYLIWRVRASSPRPGTAPIPVAPPQTDAPT